MKTGDIVRLKSGGPPMAVERLTEDNYVHCEWFVSDGKQHELRDSHFPINSLELLERRCGMWLTKHP